MWIKNNNCWRASQLLPIYLVITMFQFYSSYICMKIDIQKKTKYMFLLFLLYWRIWKNKKKNRRKISHFIHATTIDIYYIISIYYDHNFDSKYRHQLLQLLISKSSLKTYSYYLICIIWNVLLQNFSWVEVWQRV